MKIRKDLARLLLFIATIYWGIWLGGYIFNAVMLVPLWSHNPPDSMITYFRVPRFLIYFFTMVNPWVFLATLIAWLLTIKLDTGARFRLGWATLIAWIMLPLKIWMIITIGGVVRATLDGNFDPGMMNTISLWRNLNWVTIATATVILTLHLLAILNFNNPRQTNGHRLRTVYGGARRASHLRHSQHCAPRPLMRGVGRLCAIWRYRPDAGRYF